MENQIQKTTEPQGKELTQNLTAALTTSGGVDITKVNKMSLNVELKKFKDERGYIEFGKLLGLPTEKRIYAMAERDLGNTINLITVALTLAFETMNITRRMNASQIVDLAETIVDTSIEDKIAIEDLLLFLQKFTRGEYPELYEGIDQIKFMTRFNSYRDERWQEGIRIRDEKNLEYKNLGDMERSEGKLTSFDEHMSEYNQKLQAKNDEIKALRAERKRNNQ